MRALRKATKPHDCDACANGIKVGEMYWSDRRRAPRYDEFDAQVGITYLDTRTHAENCQAGDPEYIWEVPCDDHRFVWRGPKQMERYCDVCMRLEIQVHPDLPRWGLIPTGIKSWQHSRMTKAEIRAIRFNLLIQAVGAIIRRRNMAVIRMESEIAFESAHMFHTNVDVQWKVNSVLINLESLIKQNEQCNAELDAAFRDLLSFFRSLHDDYFPELEFTVSNNHLRDQYQTVRLT